MNSNNFKFTSKIICYHPSKKRNTYVGFNLNFLLNAFIKILFSNTKYLFYLLVILFLFYAYFLTT